MKYTFCFYFCQYLIKKILKKVLSPKGPPKGSFGHSCSKNVTPYASSIFLNSNYIEKTLYLGTITEKSAVAFSLGGDNLKRYFDQR